MKERDGWILYSLVYEFEEYTIEIPFYEQILAEYDVYYGKNTTYYYYPKQCWEKKKSEWNIVDTIEQNDVELIIIN